MTAVPQAYYQFVMDYAPYVYVIPPNTPDAEWGRAAFAAAFAIDFLYEAYFDQQFEDRRTEIRSKIVGLADWILTQQCTNDAKLAYGGFRSNENSMYYYSVDGCRVIPSLLKAYELTSNADYLNAAVLAGATFLYNIQHKPRELGVHDKYYGGFARAVTETDAWLQQMDVEYYVDAKTQTLEITLKLGREQPFLADYLFALRSKTDHLNMYKVARLI